LATIGPANFEIVGLTEIDKKVYKKKETAAEYTAGRAK